MLSAIHMLTLALGAAAVFARGRALARPLDDEGWRRLLAADNAWGIAAMLWIASGLGRVFYGGREPGFYWNNGFFWIKIALFAAVFLLELRPMVTFIRVRRARSQRVPVPAFPVDIFRRINAAELTLVVIIVFVAAFMARGAWLF
jgi:putative membrane protein